MRIAEQRELTQGNSTQIACLLWLIYCTHCSAAMQVPADAVSRQDETQVDPSRL